MKNPKTTAAAQPGAAPTHFHDCANWGQGGCYIYDPVAKTRTLVPDEEPAASSAGGDLKPELTAPAAGSAAANKEVNNG